MNDAPVSIFWFRRDLRVNDNAGFFHALRGDHPVLPLFIFDTSILEKLDDKSDRRVDYIHQAISQLHNIMLSNESSLLVRHGKPQDLFRQLIEEYPVAKVYTNHDYEPAAIERDSQIASLLQDKGIPFLSFKDQVIFEKDEVVKDDGKPYTVYTPYSKKWKSRLNDDSLKIYPSEQLLGKLARIEARTIPTLSEIGFRAADIKFDPALPSADLIRNYSEQRDFPGVAGTSRIGVHLRFGTISIRQAMRSAQANSTWLNELIWREFYMMILYHFPHVASRSFRPQYDSIPWINNEEAFQSWCEGRTGYPLVDAGMRELNATGFMHNRVRMVTASFLVKHLLIDWRWGESYFASKLLDYDLSANNGGWQWAAGTGTDAAPYFRVFNPAEQQKKFDARGAYVRKWIPELDELSYPQPIVDHKFARERVIAVYKKALGNSSDPGG
jgi:deoxyribodipyrimidine photo-lyase